MAFFCPIITYCQERPTRDRFFTISSTIANFDADGGTKTFTISASDSWRISSATQPWGHLSKNGNRLTLNVEANTETMPRSDSFVLVSGNKSISVSITQAGAVSLAVSVNKLNFSLSGGTQSITVTTNGEWSIGTNTASWGHLTRNGNQLSIRVDPNTSTTTRTDWFSIKAGNKEQRIKISQEGGSATLSVSSNSLNFNSSGGTQSIAITTNGTWSIGTNTASWGHLIGKGNQLSISVDPNTSTTSRTDWFSIKAGNKEQRIYISQEGSATSLSVSSNSLNFSSSGGTQSITVTTNGIWSIGVSSASWGHLVKDGNQLSIRVDQNTTTSSRSDWFTIKVGDKEQRVNIYQSASTENASINSVTVSNNVDVNGKRGLSVNVSFNIIGMKDKDAKVSCYFYDSNGDALVNINNSYGTTGSPSHVASSVDIKPRYDNTTYTNLEVKIPYDELHLTDTYSRTLRVDVYIWNYSSSKYTTITRKEKTFFTCIPVISYLKVDGSASNKTKYFGEDGGREYYSVSTNARNYETWGVPSWCRIENKLSTGFTLVCNRNTSSLSRNDYLLVKAAGKEIRIDITQAGSTNTWGISGTSRSYVENATGLTYITSQIKEKGECRLGSITENGKGIVIFGNNGAAWSSIPNSLSEKVKGINGRIVSITITNSGYYCITYDRNAWFGIVPENMKSKLNQFNNNMEEIRSISISENGSFAIVTNEHFFASDISDYSNMKKAYDLYGSIKDVCITNKGICVVCQNGVFYSNIPSNLELKLKGIDYHPDHVTYTDSGTYLITTESGRYSYHM